jgi:hypothetical protein
LQGERVEGAALVEVGDADPEMVDHTVEATPGFHLPAGGGA